MNGFRRNVKLLMGWWHEVQIVIYLIFFLVLAFFCVLDKEGLPLMVEQVPSFLLYIMFALILIVIGMDAGYYRIMVYFGSSRSPAALGMFFSHHIVVLEQLIILLVVATLVENNESMEIVRTCPLGIIAVFLLLLGSGYLVNAISLSGHKVCAGILEYTLACVFVILVVCIDVAFPGQISAEMLNNIWILLTGLVVDFIGTVVYFKTVMKADLKLA